MGERGGPWQPMGPPLLERSAVLEFPKARLNLVAGQRAEAVHAEVLATEAAHHRAVNHGAAQLRHVRLAVRRLNPLPSQIAHEAAREGIARARRVENILQQVAWRDEMLAPVEKDCAILAALDDQRARAHALDPGRR